MAEKKLPEPKKKSAKLIKLEAQITALEREKEDEVKKLTGQERADDTRRKVLAGQAVFKEALRQESFKKFLYKLLDQDLKRQYDRDVFDVLMEEWGMPPLPRLSPPAAVPAAPPVTVQKETEPT